MCTVPCSVHLSLLPFWTLHEHNVAILLVSESKTIERQFFNTVFTFYFWSFSTKLFKQYWFFIFIWFCMFIAKTNCFKHCNVEQTKWFMCMGDEVDYFCIVFVITVHIGWAIFGDSNFHNKSTVKWVSITKKFFWLSERKTLILWSNFLQKFNTFYN